MVNIAIPEDMAKKLITLLQQAMTPQTGIPTLQEVTEFARSRKSHVSANRFYTYYTNKNWRDKDGQPVTNWQEKFIAWEGYNLEKASNPNEERKTKAEELGGSASKHPVTQPQDDLALLQQYLDDIEGKQSGRTLMQYRIEKGVGNNE